MFYQTIYNSICKNGVNNKNIYGLGSNLHKHHIVPTHHGGLDTEENYTYISIREHIIAHFLLWKIYRKPNDLRSMHMLGARLTYEQRRIVGEYCRDNNIGFFSYSKEDRIEWSKRGALTQMNEKIGIHDPKNIRYHASLGGKEGAKSQIQNKIAIFNPLKRKEYASLGGKSIKGMMCVTNGSHRTRIKPEKLDEYLSNGYRLGFTLNSASDSES